MTTANVPHYVDGAACPCGRPITHRDVRQFRHEGKIAQATGSKAPEVPLCRRCRPKAETEAERRLRVLTEAVWSVVEVMDGDSDDDVSRFEDALEVLAARIEEVDPQ